MNKELLFNLYEIFSPSGAEKAMRRFVKRQLRDIDGVSFTQDAHNNIFVTKGISETYPCLASHLDQVQRKHSKDFTCIESKGVVFGYSPKSHEQQGLGADDKNGIYICLELLKRFDVLKVAFFSGEETGCVGSSSCDMSFFADCRFIIEPDRRGHSDLITSMFVGSVCSKAFTERILGINCAQKFGYREDVGSITDVGTLVERGVGISCLNLSCGYYEAHTDREFTVLDELENCLNYVAMIVEKVVEVYPFVNTFSKYGYYDSFCPSYNADGTTKHSWYNTISEDSYYDDGFYNEDFQMMVSLLDSKSAITFDEIECDWFGNFWTDDKDILRDLYDDAKNFIGVDDDDFGEILFEIDEEKEKNDEYSFDDITVTSKAS